MHFNLSCLAIHRYSTKSEDEIKLDRYAKFRKLGDYADYPVVGGLWREARDERAKVNVAHICLCCLSVAHGGPATRVSCSDTRERRLSTRNVSR